MRFLAVVDVVARLGELVVTRHRGLQSLCRKAQLLGELFNRVGLHDVALLDETRKHLFLHHLPGDVGIGSVFKREHARTAVHLELFRVLNPVAVKERVVAVALLEFVGVQDVFVRA